MTPPAVIGVLALQGAYARHVQALTALGAIPSLIKQPSQLSGLSGLIIPGGESTALLKHLEQDGFFDVLKTFVRETPTLGTCAGAILLAAQVRSPEQRSLAALDITIERNGYGRQADSAILTLPSSLPGADFEMVFIRAPRIISTGPEVEVLARRDDDPVLVRKGHLLVATFHPELSGDHRVHQLFLEMVATHRLSEAAETSA